MGGILLIARLGSARTFFDGGEVKTRTPWDHCVGLVPVVKRIRLGVNGFSTPRATSFMHPEMECFELY